MVLRVVPALLLLAALIPLLRRPRLLRSLPTGLLASPLGLGFLMLAGIVLFAHWPSFLPRYLNAEFVLLAMFAAWAWLELEAPPRTMVAAATAASLLSAAVWVYMAGAYYFTNVGGSLGIHA